LTAGSAKGRSEEGRSEKGSALMLMPAAVLIVVVLGALVVDNATVWLGQRELGTAAAAAATDAASAVYDPAFYQSGQVVLDPARAVTVALRSVAAQDLSGVQLTGAPTVEVQGRQVCVTLTGVVRPILGRAIPGFGESRSVHARAVATVAGDSGSAVAPRGLC